MSESQAYIAIDLGAESGRAMLATLENERLTLEQVHRFAHHPCTLPTGLHWDLTHLWQNIVEGIGRGVARARERGLGVASVGVDTWGVDWTLLGESGEVLVLPHCYRDERHAAAFERVVGKLGQPRIYEQTGIQFMPINTLYQLAAHHRVEPGVFEQARTLAFMPDLFHYWLTGRRTIEATIASTSQMVDIQNGGWATSLLETLGIPAHVLEPTIAPGTEIGPLRETLADELDIEPMEVIAPATHDTASAVAAIPATEPGWCFLSSGTWSLMGAEIREPRVTDAAREASFTHELGIGAYRFLKNIGGLWLVQECRRAFEAAGERHDYAELTRLAEQSEALRTIINPNHGPFLHAGHMPEKIVDYARRTGQPAPESVGDFVRCCLEGLALMYRHTLEGLERVLDQRFDRLHVVGGGGRNELLNQMTADAIGRPVVVGPYEATAAGNALVQAMGTGAVRDQAHIRQIMARSAEPVTFEPVSGEAWEAAYDRFVELLEADNAAEAR